MDYKKTIENADHFMSVFTTENGYPIYDIMIPFKLGHCTASGLVFYVEDESILKEFKGLNEEKQKEFLIKNIQYVKKTQEVRDHSPDMDYSMNLAFGNLLRNFEGTVKNALYGGTHLVDEGKLLIFGQQEVLKKIAYKIDADKNFVELYNEMETLIFNAYKKGLIKPEAVLSPKALLRIQEKNPSMFKEMTKYQRESLEIIKDFKNEILGLCRLTYDKREERLEDLKVGIDINGSYYDINIPDKGIAPLTYSVSGETKEFKNVYDLIVSLHKEINEKKLNAFMKKIKP